jgi:hypothetical protein
MHLESYQNRQIQFLELFTEQGWQLKVYSILHPDKTLSLELIQVAKETALEFLPDASEPGNYGVGFISVHQGKSYDFVTVGYWNYSTELRHQTYMRPSSADVTLEALTASELSSDVWDIRLLGFEREAWVEVLKAGNPKVESYIAKRLNEVV